MSTIELENTLKMSTIELELITLIQRWIQTQQQPSEIYNQQPFTIDDQQQPSEIDDQQQPSAKLKSTSRSHPGEIKEFRYPTSFVPFGSKPKRKKKRKRRKRREKAEKKGKKQRQRREEEKEE